ncbi:unnamed protein product [Psylliodes chrysocephalus]|uniref:C2H2-type domain-containing protein n=1 Tax=Psylliodes chrysocephalus TaxID=3402493 RepID=A0A9P0CVR4_9CUCU|nr:unnamed protein product [Psylliodes chrysocephala]
MEISKLKSELNCDEQTQIVAKPVKRPFDVAFLMLPDEKLKQKQKLQAIYDNSYNSTEEDEEIDIMDTPREYKKLYTHKLDQSSLIKPKNLDDLRSKSLTTSSSEQKSAFTKVNLGKDTRLSPALSVSPDLNYQSSLSPSPPIINKSYQNFSGILTPNQLFKNQQLAYQHQFLQDNFHHTSPANLENNFFKSQPELLQPNFAKIRPIYRPDLTYGYQQFSNPEMLKMAPPELRSPAAAILTSLLPPSLAALSLPAQNICAKCNISFRMTSDLVYHMRSHHKNETGDTIRKKREDKLKCPVCAESFRERHHLTRHMTAHQDKDEDEEKASKKGF